MVVMLYSAAAHADDKPAVKLSGYGTVAAATIDDESLEYSRNDISKGLKNQVDIGFDSRLGVQLDVDFQNGLSAMWQVVAKRRIANLTAGDDKDFDIRTDWLYAQYQFRPGLNVRLGRMALPTFLLSDSLDIGYAAPWLRAPVHMYASSIVTSFDGVQANVKFDVGPVNISVQTSTGKSKTYLIQSGINTVLPVDPLNALNVVVEWNDWLARAGSMKSKSVFFDMPIKDTYDTAGLQYDNGKALVMAEYARRATKTTLNDLDIVQRCGFGYVALGWHFGKLLPLAMVSRFSIHYPTSLAGDQYLRAASRAAGVSLRYDVAPNIALKAQVERFRAKDAVAFLAPRTDDPTRVHVYTVGIDFIF